MVNLSEKYPGWDAIEYGLPRLKSSFVCDLKSMG